MRGFDLIAEWGNRPEGLEKCTDRVFSFFECLVRVSSLLSSWVVRTSSRSVERAEGFQITRDSISGQLLPGVLRRDSDQSVIEELGYSLHVTTPGRLAQAITLDIRCGAQSPNLAALVPNHLTMEFPPSPEIVERVLTVDTLVQIFECVAETMAPAWGIVDAREHLLKRAKPRVGWISYVPVPSTDLPALPANASVRDAPGGSLVIATEELFRFDEPRHVEVVAEIEAVLANTQALPPLDSWQ